MRSILIIFFVLFLNLIFAQQQDQAPDAKLKAERYKAWQVTAVQTENQSAYDVYFYDLVLDLYPDTEMLSGQVGIYFTAVEDMLGQIDLNFSDNMQIDGVSDHNGPLAWSHENHILTVTLPQFLINGAQGGFTVQYHGQPQQTGLGAFDFGTYNKKPMIWSLSEPYGAREWWPCKDIPADKADSVNITVTVPKGMVVASNGLLTEQYTDEGRTTFFWQERYPITTYLVSIAAHEYYHYSDEYISAGGKTMPIEFYIFPDHQNTSLPTYYARTKEMIAAFSGYYGEYPFINEKYGHAEFLWGGGMEHQTCTSLGGWSEGLIAHELSHQWWGDMVTCQDFHHIWLNEGFATYSEALWLEYSQGPEAYHNEINKDAYTGGGTVYVPDDTDVNRIFHGGLSYSKGGFVLHMLRHVVGDSIFFDILQTYYNDPARKYGTATTEDFKAVCQAVSGMALDYFFDQWIYHEYYPKYEYYSETVFDGSNYHLHLNLLQTQTNTILFKMPLDIHITTTSGTQVFTILDSVAGQEFEFILTDQPQSLEIDPDNWVLKSVTELNRPALNRGILLVNGVDWSKYYETLSAAYDLKAFQGDFDFTFHDVYNTPAQGYPSALPGPVGHGFLDPDSVLNYSTMIWVGGDGIDWIRFYYAEIMNYIRLGGNVILISPNGKNVIQTPEMQTYLGIRFFADKIDSITVYTSEQGALQPMTAALTMPGLYAFDPAVENGSHLLFSAEEDGLTYGLGVRQTPDEGGVFKEDGGQFVFIAAMPQNLESSALRNNITKILVEDFGEPVSAIPPPGNNLPLQFKLTRLYPNPFNPTMNIEFMLNHQVEISLVVYNSLGQQVQKIVDRKQLPAGLYNYRFDGSHLVSGVYFVRLNSGTQSDTRKIVLLH